MITFSRYAEFLATMSAAGLQSRTIATLAQTPPQKCDIFLKHDVESRVDRALEMARIEARYRHSATYYFQGDLLDSPITIAAIAEMTSLGHEVTYHYDVLDSCDGDYSAAMLEFQEYVARFAKLGCVIKTVCPHGNPTKIRKGWQSNKDFFRHPGVRNKYPNIMDIVVDFPVLFNQGIYVSDAGFNLKIVGAIATNDSSNQTAMQDGHTIDWSDITQLAQESEGMVMSVHPHRFQSTALGLGLQRYGFAALKWTYMAARGMPIVRQLANRFYTLTRKL